MPRISGPSLTPVTFTQNVTESVIPEESVSTSVISLFPNASEINVNVRLLSEITILSRFESMPATLQERSYEGPPSSISYSYVVRSNCHKGSSSVFRKSSIVPTIWGASFCAVTFTHSFWKTERMPSLKARVISSFPLAFGTRSKLMVFPEMKTESNKDVSHWDMDHDNSIVVLSTSDMYPERSHIQFTASSFFSKFGIIPIISGASFSALTLTHNLWVTYAPALSERINVISLFPYAFAMRLNVMLLSLISS